MWLPGERHSIETLQTVIDVLPMPIFLKDEHHRWVVVNESFCQLMGRSREELLGKSDFDFVPEQQAAVFWAIDDHVFASGQPNENEEAITDGEGHIRTLLTRKRLVRVADQRSLLVGVIFDVTLYRETEAQVRHLALHDVLTGVANRCFFKQRLDSEVARAQRTGELLAVLCLDLDRFKDVNDLFGHSAGDALLKGVAARLLEGLRADDTVARLGGDEFAIILPRIGSAQAALEAADRLIEGVSQTQAEEAFEAPVGVSVGIALYPADALDAESLTRRADIALYRAKADGRGKARLFAPDMDERLREMRELQRELKSAIGQEDELVLHYQPQFNLRAKRLVGFEALVRWRHPRRGLVPPGEFVPLAEETGLILPLGDWVLRRACGDAVRWPHGLTVSVNVSAAQLKQRDLVQTFRDVLSESGLAAERLEVEITETVLLQDTETTLRTLGLLKTMGVRIAMDDFGTGYSSLGYLRRFPFDRLKIDRSFTSELGHRADADAIVAAALSLGKNLNMTATAEGVETAVQLARLGSMGCDQVQGFFCGRPMDSQTVSRALGDRRIGLDLKGWSKLAEERQTYGEAAMVDA